MPGPRGNGSKRGGTSIAQNGHTSCALGRRRSQRFDQSTLGPSGGRRNSVDTLKSGSGHSTPERDPPPGSSASTSSASMPSDSAHLVNTLVYNSRIHVEQSPSSPSFAAKSPSRSSQGGVLPPHQYLDSLALTFFLANLPSIFLVLIHLLFVIFAVSPYSGSTERYSSWKAILSAEAVIVLFFALVSPSIRAYITEFAEPVIASTLAGNGGYETAICVAIMFTAGRIPEVLFGSFIRLKRCSPGVLSDTIVLTANYLETESQALDRLGDELQAWALALIRQLIAIHVVAGWSWEGLKVYLTNRVNQSKLEDTSGSSYVDVTSVNRRKKQTMPISSNLSRMPLWTTIANNYIIAAKEAELKPPEDLAAFTSENECVLHIREITSNSVRLCARGPRNWLESTLGPLESFEVRVNGLQWREIMISLDEDDRSDDHTLYHQELVCLYLDIQEPALSPVIEIEVSNSGLPDPGVVLFHSTIGITQKDVTAAAPIVAHQTVRPNSPISTLTDKVNDATENLKELKNKQRRIRKDHKSTIASLRSEIEALHSRLEAPDKGEERAKRGNLAMKHRISQTEYKIRKLTDDVQLVEESIASRKAQLASGLEKWESERSALNKSFRSQSETKSSYDKFLQQFHVEQSATNVRKDKLTSRETKLKADLDILEATERKRMEECGDRSKRRQEARAQVIRDRQAKHAKQLKEIDQMETMLTDVKERTASHHAERLVLERIPVLHHPSDVVVGHPTTSP